jgi:hypothetical protein
MSINLITCVKFFKTLVDNATDFAAENSLKKEVKSLDELKTIRSNFCQILWLRSILSDLTEKVNKAVFVYDTNISPIIKNVVDIVNQENTNEYSLLYDMWDMNYTNTSDMPEDVSRSWADATEYDDMCRHLKSMKDNGYPDVNNIRPIRELRGPNNIAVENKFMNREEKKTKYYDYEVGGQRIMLPMVDELSEIPSCFYYYKGSKLNPRGIYMSPAANVVLQVPDVNVVPYSVENTNHFSMKCVQGKLCKNFRCKYAHPGTDYNKIGCVSRCPGAHSFGNKDSLQHDVKFVTYEDWRRLAMYGVNDMFCTLYWLNCNVPHNRTLKVITNLEVCDDYSLIDDLQNSTEDKL